MARKATVINISLAQSIINEEQNSWSGGLNPFLEHVWNIYNRKVEGTQYPKLNNFQVLGLRLKDPGCSLKCDIQPGKRGKKKGFVISDEQKEKMKAGRLLKSKRSLPEDVADSLVKHFDKPFKHLVDRFISHPTSKLAVKLKCIDCCGQENVPSRIRDCNIYSCSVWAFRPYQTSDKDDEDVS